MSRALFSRNADLKRLRDEGYYVQIVGGYLVMREVPYVNDARQVKRGTLISSLTMAGDETRTPDTHVVNFDGDFPCDSDGKRISQISHQSAAIDLGNGLTAKHSFSSKPADGYADYYAKMVTYATVLSGPAAVLESGATPRLFKTPEVEQQSVLNYLDTASARAGVGALADRLKQEVVAIIGTGGSGSHILDSVAKTEVPEIRIFDGDDFLLHNAFRTPGAPLLEELREAPKKVDYLKAIYSRMHGNILAHPKALDASNLDLLNGVTFAFISMDAGEEKRLVIEKLEAIGAAFVDVGMGLELDDGSLGGILRVTASTPEKRDHVRNRISFAGGGEKNVYATNIQINELNALNAALAVIKWKKIRGFYRDMEREHNSSYTTDGNMLLNGDEK
jgi:hypothetical protein